LAAKRRENRPQLSLELHQLDFEGRRSQIQARHADRQMKPPRPRTARIDVEDAIALELPGLMGMAADDHVESRGPRVQVKRMYVVQNVKLDAARLRDSGLRQRFRPIFLIDVSAHSNHQSKFSESGENFGLSHVSGMENQLRTAKGF